MKDQDLRWLYFLTALAVLPALLINLGLLTLITDEPTRALVSLEMMISGDYLTPTLNGLLYTNKPPLFNWLLIAFMRVTGSSSEFVLRLPVILSVLGIGLSLYFLLVGRYGRAVAFIAAMAFITSGRVLFWDSYRSLIDLPFALLVICQIFTIIRCHEKQRWWQLFMLSWLFTTVGFFLKGLPALAFQGITLLAVFIHDRDPWRLFSFKNMVGFLLFLGFSGAYFIAYSRESSVQGYLSRLVSETNRLQSAKQGLFDLVVHYLSFPIAIVYDFLPWPLLAILLLKRGAWKVIRKDREVFLFAIVFASNIIIYWISANMRARYIFPLLPFLLIPLIYLYFQPENGRSRPKLIVDWIFLVLIGLAALSSLVYPFWSETRGMKYVAGISIAMFAVKGLVLYGALRFPRHLLLFASLSLLLTRIDFDVFHMPARYASMVDARNRADYIRAAEQTKGKPLYIFRNTPVNHDASFYITRERGEILSYTSWFRPEDAYYLMNGYHYFRLRRFFKDIRPADEFDVKLLNTHVYMVRLSREESNLASRALVDYFRDRKRQRDVPGS